MYNTDKYMAQVVGTSFRLRLQIAICSFGCVYISDVIGCYLMIESRHRAPILWVELNLARAPSIL